MSHIAAGHLGSDGSAKAVAHGAKSAGGEKGSRLSVFVVLGSPHLVLANLSTDNCVAFRQLINGLHDKRTSKLGLGIAERIHILHHLDVLEPVLMVHRVQTGIEFSQNHLQITDDACVSVNVLVDLCRIHIDLKDLRVLCELGRVAGHTITEAGTCHDQQIALADAEVGSLGSMHTYHAGVKLIGSVKCALAHQGISNRCLDLVSQHL